MKEGFFQSGPGAQPLGGSWSNERWLGFFFAVFGYALYFPLSGVVETLEPIDVSMPLDAMIPLVPGWILIYAGIYPAAFLPLVVVKDPMIFRRMIAGYLCLELTALILFVVFPVHMTLRPPIETVTEPGFFPWAVQLCYWMDRPVNCFPSLHVAAATFSALCALRVDRLVGWISSGVAVLIALSTFFVKQHFIADALLGAGIATFWFLTWIRGAQPLGSGPLAYPRSMTRIPIAMFAAVVGLIFLLYVAGWTPWIA